MAKVEKICKECKNTFNIERWRLKDKNRGKFCSVYCTRKYYSGENHHFFGKKRPEISGENSKTWKGDNTGYTGLHIRVSKKRGEPTTCEKCGSSDENRRYEWASLNKDYSNVDDYIRLCVPCHREMDGNMPVNRFLKGSYASL